MSGLSALLFAGMSFFLLPYYLVSLRPDYIVVEPGISSLGFLWVPILPFFRNTKFVLDIRSTPVEVAGLHGRMEVFLFMISVIFAKVFFDGITVITSLMRNEICEKFGINKEFVGVWTSGVSQELFDPQKYSEEETDSLKRKLGLNGKFIVFYHGYFGVKRGILECVRSISLIGNKCNDLVLFLLGNGPALSEIEKEILVHGLQDKVFVHRPVTYKDVPKYISMCDVGIVPLPDLPDWRHQCPLKLLELMSMRKPVILTSIPAHKEVIGDGKCGIYVSSVNPVEIAGAITYAHENKDNLEHLKTCGKNIVNMRYTWNKVAEDFDSYLSKVQKRRCIKIG
jgi:glycosyltransferase involved in cell wall biosynthesis